MISSEETNNQAAGLIEKTAKTDAEVDFKKIANNLETHLEQLQKTACPKHEKVKLSCVCLNPDCRISVLCSKCLIDDLEHYKTCGKRQQIFQMAELRQQYPTVLRLSNGFDLEAVKKKLSLIRQSSLEMVHQKVAQTITCGIESQINKMFQSIEEKQNSAASQVKIVQPEANEATNQATQDDPPEDDWELLDENEDSLSADMFCDLELTEFMSVQKLGNLTKGLYHDLQDNSRISLNTGINRLEVSHVETILHDEHLKNFHSQFAKRFARGLSGRISQGLGILPDRSNAICCKRFVTINNPYHYQDMHRHNSISFKLNQDSYLFGYSAFLIQNVDDQVIVIKVTKGIRTQDDQKLVEFESRFYTNPEYEYETQTRHTKAVFFDSPVFLEANVDYTISFDKPRSTYIYYGSTITQNPIQFGNEGKTVTFRRAECDQYDNTDSVGQFPDLYLYQEMTQI